MGRPKVYDDDLRRRLVARAAEMMSERGPSGLAVREVAAAEGTSTSAIYSMFEDRAGLIRDVGVTAGLGFVAAQRAVPMTDDPYEDLFSLGRAYRSWAIQHPALYQVLMTPAEPDLHLDGPLPESRAADPLREVVVRLIDASIFRPVDPNMAVAIIWASVHGFVSLELAGYFQPASLDQKDAAYEVHLEAIGRGWSLAA